MRRSRYTLKTLRKGLDVIELMAEDRDSLTLTVLAHRLRQAQPVIFRILHTLEERGYVEQDEASKRWRLGFRAWEVGCRAVHRTGVLEASHSALKWLTAVTEETSYLAVVRGTDTVYLDVVEGLEPLRVYAEPGFRVPLYLTASGKAILAFRDDALFEAVVKAGLKRQTPTTITKASVLRARLAEIRKKGLSVNRGERRSDISAVAAPVFNRTGECVAALGISGPSQRFTGERLERASETVRKAAQEAAARLGHLTLEGRTTPARRGRPASAGRARA
jgi:DNA-binding IclR family transcriptional regulator